MSLDLASGRPARQWSGAGLLRLGIPVALAAVLVFFSFAAPGFLSVSNIAGVLVNNVALAAIVSLAMTMTVASGGTDLSVGTAVDLGSLAFVAMVAAGQPLWLACLCGGLAGLGVGGFNAVLITRLSITPFIATLGTLFIGHTLQQLATDGGNPIYIAAGKQGAGLATLGHGTLLAVPVALWLVAALAIAVWIALERLSFGRQVRAIGTQPLVAFYSGLPVSRVLALVYVFSGGIAALAGILLSAHVNAYVPYSGNAYLLDAIGAAFIGTSLSARRRPNVLGTLLGVLLLGFVSNGLLLIGWNYYWQQVGTGVLIFLALVLAFAGRSDAKR